MCVANRRLSRYPVSFADRNRSEYRTHWDRPDSVTPGGFLEKLGKFAKD
jgi:hypothetical protein